MLDDINGPSLEGIGYFNFTIKDGRLLFAGTPLDNPRLAPSDASWPGEAPEVSLISHVYQYLTEMRFDQIEPILGFFAAA